MDRLAGVHPQLRAKIIQILAEMKLRGHTMMITDGVRFVEDQQAAYAKGRTTPGPNVRTGHPLGDTVTRADGVRKKSNHQLHADGCGHAVDCCFVVDGKPSWDERLPWGVYGALGKALGLVWGGDWPSRDRPHLEMP